MNENNETIIYQKRPAWLNYYLLYLMGIVFFVFFIMADAIFNGIVMVLFFIGLAAIFRLRYLFTVTGERVMQKVGLIARNTNEMKIRHIRSMHVKQNPIERILGIGTLTTVSAADGEAAVIFKGIRDPQGVKERLRSL
jgi:uncharacterized membrane protein YdbT with pleckstrin-like domain